MPTGESTASTESTGSLPSLVLFSVSTQPWHAFHAFQMHTIATRHASDSMQPATSTSARRSESSISAILRPIGTPADWSRLVLEAGGEIVHKPLPCHFDHIPITFPSHSHHIFPSHSHHIPITFPSHSQHIPITFPAHFNRIPITFASHLHHICITFPAHFNHIPITSPPPSPRMLLGQLLQTYQTWRFQGQ